MYYICIIKYNTYLQKDNLSFFLIILESELIFTNNLHYHNDLIYATE